MASDTLLFERADGIARITLNRPDKLNSFNVEMHEALRDALTQVQADKSLRVLVLTGAGRAFWMPTGQAITGKLTMDWVAPR